MIMGDLSDPSMKLLGKYCQINVLTGKYCQINVLTKEQGKSEGFDNCNWPSNLAQTGFKSLIFQPVWPWNLMDNLEKW